MFAVFSTARKALTTCAAIAGSLALAACDTAMIAGGPDVGPRIDRAEPVRVALLLPKSEAGASGVARSLENAARLAVADVQGAQIDLRVYDTAGVAAQAASQAQQAVDEGAQVILGPLFAEAANAAGRATADEGVNVLSFSNNPSIAGGNVFVLGQTFQNTADRLVSYAASQGKRTAVIVHPSNVEGAFGRQAIEAAAARHGMSIASVEAFEFSQAGVVDAAPRIKRAVTDSGADALFLTSNSAGALPLLGQLLPEQGLGPEVTQYIGLARWDVPPETLRLPALQGGWFALPDPARSASFEARYSGAYGSAPHPLAGLAYDGISAIAALAREGRAPSTAGLTQGAGFQGTAGAFRLRPNGTNERNLAVATIQNQQVVILDPAPASFGGAGF